MVSFQSPTQTQPLSWADQRVIHQGLTWQQFKLIQSGFGGSRKLRLFYGDQTLEILMPGRNHELFKSILGFLIELFCLEVGLEFEPLGSTTQECPGQSSVEPDESYCFGEALGPRKLRPDLAIEIVVTSGGPDKLQRYRSLQIPEVWFWENGTLHSYHLHGDIYEPIAQSEIPELAMLDLTLLSRCVLIAQTSRLEAAKTLRQSLPSRS